MLPRCRAGGATPRVEGMRFLVSLCLLLLLAVRAEAFQGLLRPSSSSSTSSPHVLATAAAAPSPSSSSSSSSFSSASRLLAEHLSWPLASRSSRTRLQSMAMPSVSKVLTAVPRFLGRKLMDGGDAIYLKKCLFLPPGSSSAAAAAASTSSTSTIDGTTTSSNSEGNAAAASSEAQAASSPPPNTDMVLVFYPGIGLGPPSYKDTALAIQDALAQNYDIQAYVVIAKFVNNLGYLPQEPERRLVSILSELGKQGISPRAPLAIVGHSGGAFLAYDAALTRAQAFVHLGSTLNSRGVLPWTPRSVVEYPKPILQLLGEMDGYIRFTGGALEYAEVEGLMAKKGFEEVLLEKPVVVLPGVSHQQFGDGHQSKMARMSGRRDLPPYVSLQEAQRMTGKIVGAFLALHLFPGNGRARMSGSNVVRSAFEATGRMVRPYLNEMTEQAEDDFVRWAQAEVASVEGVGRNSVRACVFHTEQEFIYSKPTLDGESEYLQVCVRKQQDKNTIKIGFTKQISPAFGLKMKRQEAVVQVLRRYPSKKAPTAAELNRRTFQKALERVSEEARRRYDRYGRKLEFLADDEITAERGGGPAWVAAPLEVKPRGEDPMRVTVRSPVLYTPIDTLPRFAGMCYMKLLTPAQAIEWICHDAFIPWDSKA